jgi:GPN-loop GTPase
MTGGKCSIQFVMGPAGSGKSTYCAAMQQHVAAMNEVSDVMKELSLGPNGALLYCMEYLLTDGMDW